MKDTLVKLKFDIFSVKFMSSGFDSSKSYIGEGD